MKIVLTDINPEMCAQWTRAFDGVPDVEVHHGSFTEITDADGIVSPANSFGHMNGGIDGAYTGHFGRGLQRFVQDVILCEHDGELPVGKAITVPIRCDHQQTEYKWLVVAPTMRTPRPLEGTANVLFSTRAAFREARRHGIQKLVVPGMGTGAGGVDPVVCADHMLAAYLDSLKVQHRVMSFSEAAAEESQFTITSAEESQFTITRSSTWTDPNIYQRLDRQPGKTQGSAGVTLVDP